MRSSLKIALLVVSGFVLSACGDSSSEPPADANVADAGSDAVDATDAIDAQCKKENETCAGDCGCAICCSGKCIRSSSSGGGTTTMCL